MLMFDVVYKLKCLTCAVTYVYTCIYMCVCFFSNNMHANMSRTIKHLKMTILIFAYKNDKTLKISNTVHQDHHRRQPQQSVPNK